MDFLNKISGAVFFVDILGIGALTNNRIDLDRSDYKHWLDNIQLEHNNQHLAAALLGTFRKILSELHADYEDVRFAQLSDCAFIWSENIAKVVIIANKLMTKCVKNGILCRGGMSYGEILETTQHNDLGKFIIGKAVTEAVKLEGLAKGARVLVSEEFPTPGLWENDQKFRKSIDPLFQPFINPLDYITYDEFKWYLYPDIPENVVDLRRADYKFRLQLTKERIKLAAIINHSPMFNWNTKSKEGLIQLRATITFVTERDLLDVEHNFDWSIVSSHRGTNIVEKLNQTIENDEDFKDLRHHNF